MMRAVVASFFTAAALLLFAPVVVVKAQFNEEKFDRLVEKVEADAIELAQKVEELYKNRCELAILADCVNGNYDHCMSSYPDETCPGGDDLNRPECGDGTECSALYSFSVSSIALPSEVANGPGRNPTDPLVIETICFTKPLDEFIAAKRAADQPFWEEIGYPPNQYYFGSTNGAFRLSPATHYSSCNTYDPRVRPWYVAASSGPKNIIMVLDHSGSMQNNNKIGILKEAATRVISTSTVADRIAVIPFNNMASEITNDGFMFDATEDNKAEVIAQIDALGVGGGTNFYDAFTTAFDVLDRSIADEVTVNCNTAILFLTDGKMTLPEGLEEQVVIDLVEQRLNATAQNIGKPIYLFTYSVSGGDPEVDEFPKMLACSTGGVWSKIEYEEEIVESLSNYYSLLALGLGEGANQDFTAWVEPYVFIPGDTVGTTISAPVYDRDKEPSLFLGVVGIDFTLDALDSALGITSDSDSNESFERVVQRSTARCPQLILSECTLESYRRQSSVGDEALCSNACAAEDFVQIEAEKCATVSDYPTDLWINRDYEFVSFVDKVCCRLGETVPDNTCFATDEDDGGASPAVIAGAVAGSGAVVVALVLFRLYYRKKKTSGEDATKEIEATTIKEIEATTQDGRESTDRQDDTATASSPGTNIAEDESVIVANATLVPQTHELDYKNQWDETPVAPVTPVGSKRNSSANSPDPIGIKNVEL